MFAHIRPVSSTPTSPAGLTSLMAASRPGRDLETSAVLADPRTDRDEPLDGPNYPRLAALEQKDDPTNFFRETRTSSQRTRDLHSSSQLGFCTGKPSESARFWINSKSLLDSSDDGTHNETLDVCRRCPTTVVNSATPESKRRRESSNPVRDRTRRNAKMGWDAERVRAQSPSCLGHGSRKWLILKRRDAGAVDQARLESAALEQCGRRPQSHFRQSFQRLDPREVSLLVSPVSDGVCR